MNKNRLFDDPDQFSNEDDVFQYDPFDDEPTQPFNKALDKVFDTNVYDDWLTDDYDLFPDNKSDPNTGW